MMMELDREVISAALLLSWLKHTKITEQDVQTFETVLQKHNHSHSLNPTTILEAKKFKKLEKTKRKHLFDKTQQTPQTPKAITPRNYKHSPKKIKISQNSTEFPRFPPVENLEGLIGKCSNPFVKKLTKSDVDEHQGRLLLNNEDVRRELLPLLSNEDLASGIKVKTFDQLGHCYEMTFKSWGNYKTHVLLGSWRQFCKDHELKEHDCVNVWMFRHSQTRRLCFALTWKRYSIDSAPIEQSDEQNIGYMEEAPIN